MLVIDQKRKVQKLQQEGLPIEGSDIKQIEFAIIDGRD
jgi:hypothetical protein